MLYGLTKSGSEFVAGKNYFFRQCGGVSHAIITGAKDNAYVPALYISLQRDAPQLSSCVILFSL